MTEYKDEEKLSSCCVVPMYSDNDICTKCGECAIPMDIDEVEELLK